MTDYPYYWRWGNLPFKSELHRKGQPLRVLARGKMNSALVEFKDGFRAVVSRNGIARRK